MAQDFAKGKKGSSGRKSSSRKTSRSRTTNNQLRGRGLRLYLGGVVTGIFISFIAYLTTLPEPPGQESASAAPEKEAPPKPRFDFYTLLPTQTIEVDEPVEPATDISAPPPTTAPDVNSPIRLAKSSARVKKPTPPRPAPTSTTRRAEEGTSATTASADC